MKISYKEMYHNLKELTLKWGNERDEARRWARKLKVERDDWRRWYERLEGHSKYLEADNARLRELIKSVETAKIEADWYDGDVLHVCPWCNYGPDPHDDDCPAFNPDGTVK